MEIEVKNGKFYLLEMGEKRYLYATEEEALEALPNKVGNAEEENIFLWRVDVTGENWAIEQVPWSKIALSLLKKKGGKHGGS